MKSARVSGPIGTFVPSFIVLSMSSAVLMPSYKANTASLIYGIKILLAINPGMSLAVEHVLPIFSANATVAACTAGSVYSPLMTSTSFITGTGFMKCMPITWCALEGMQPAILVIEMLEVLVAKIE